MLFFIAQLMTILVLNGMVFGTIWEMFHGRISLNLVLLLLLLNFVSRFRSELMHISLIINIRSSRFYSCIVHRNHFFLYQEDKFCTSKVKFRHSCNCSKMFLEATKLAYASKKNSLLFPTWKLASRVFRQYLIVFSTKADQLFFFYIMALR